MVAVPKPDKGLLLTPKLLFAIPSILGKFGDTKLLCWPNPAFAKGLLASDVDNCDRFVLGNGLVACDAGSCDKAGLLNGLLASGVDSCDKDEEVAAGLFTKKELDGVLWTGLLAIGGLDDDDGGGKELGFGVVLKNPVGLLPENGFGLDPAGLRFSFGFISATAGFGMFNGMFELET